MNVTTDRISSAVSRILIPSIIIVVGFAGFLGLALSRQRPPEVKPTTTTPLVETVQVQSYEGVVGIDVNGFVVPYREIVVASELDGVVAFKAEECQAGRFVEGGTTLVRIDRRDYDNEVERLEAEATQSATMIQELEEEIKGAIEQEQLVLQEVEVQKSELDRAEDLHGVLSQSELDQKRRNWLTARNALVVVANNLRVLQTRESRMEAALLLANKKLARARLDAERTDILAPTDGVVVEERVESGAFVSRGSPLFVFEDTERAEVQCSLRIDEIARILENAPSDMGPYDLPGNRTHVEFTNGDTTVRWIGKLARYNGIGLDEKTRTVPCIVEVDTPVAEATNGIRTLVRGMYVKLRIEVEPISEMLEIPAVALVSRNEVWVVRDNRLVRQRVRLARPLPEDLTSTSDGISNRAEPDIESEPETVIVYSIPGQLERGDTIVTSPPGSSVEGMEVRIEKGQLP